MPGCGSLQVVVPLCQVKGVVGSAAKSVGNDIFSTIAHYFAGVAKSAVNWLWQQVSEATTINLRSPDLKRDLIATASIAALVTFSLFLIQVIASTLRQDSGGLGRAMRGLGIAFLGAAFAIASIQVVLAAVDGLSSGVVQFAFGTDTKGLGTKLVAASTLSSITNPAGLLLISLVLIAAVVVVWVALMIRKMLIIIAAVFAPIAFSGAASDVSRSWVRRWIEVTLALIFSKLILVIIFMIGLSVLDEAGEKSSGESHATTSVTNLVIGALILLLAGFAPWLAIKMVHFAGDGFHVVHGHAGAATAGGRAVVAAPQKVALVRHQASSVAAAARTTGGSSGASSTPRPPTTGSPGAAGAVGGVVVAAGAAAPRAARTAGNGVAGLAHRMQPSSQSGQDGGQNQNGRDN